MALAISPEEPPRSTIAFRGEPDDSRVNLKPRASESMATNTPTVPAMPSTATTVEVQRARRLRTAQMSGMATSNPPERVDDPEPAGRERRKDPRHQAHRQREPEAQDDRVERQLD